MSRTFNCGLGAVLIVDKRDESEVLRMLSEAGTQPACVGSVVEGQGMPHFFQACNLYKNFFVFLICFVDMNTRYLYLKSEKN